MPDMFTALALFIVGFFMLMKGADFFVESAAKIAKIIGVSEFIIGLTLIALGTSLPELGAGIIASYSGETEIVLGNVVGSNIANIALILGMSSVIAPITTHKKMFYRDGYMLIIISLIFYYFAYDGAVNSLEGIILLGLFFLYTLILLKFKPRINRFKEYVNYLYDLNKIEKIENRLRILKNGRHITAHMSFLRVYLLHLRRLLKAGRRVGVFSMKRVNDNKKGDYLQSAIGYRERLKKIKEYQEQLKESLIHDIGVIFVSGIMIYLGSKFFIGGAIDIATILGIGPSIIGLTLVSIGTSLPELMVSLQSAKKGFNQMVIGNIIGSNIANITLVLGICSLIAPVSLGSNPQIEYTNIHIILPFMIFMSFMGVISIRVGWRVQRFEGILFLLMYAGFLIWLISCPCLI